MISLIFLLTILTELGSVGSSNTSFVDELNTVTGGYINPTQSQFFSPLASGSAEETSGSGDYDPNYDSTLVETGDSTLVETGDSSEEEDETVSEADSSGSSPLETDDSSEDEDDTVSEADSSGTGVCQICDFCASAPCENGGTCIDGANSYTCQCAPGFDGEHCACVAGYEGDDCDNDIDECGTNPCQNGASCSTPNLNSYECACVDGYEGDDCETDIDECSPDPCQNGASCSTPNLNSYECACVAGYEGDDCETDIDDCASVQCQNGGECIDDVNSYTCECARSFEGTSCENWPSHDSGPSEVAQWQQYGLNYFGYQWRHTNQPENRKPWKVNIVNGKKKYRPASRRRLTGSAQILLNEICLDVRVHPNVCTPAEPSYISMQVHRPPAPGVEGCPELKSFYNAVRDKLVSELPSVILALGDNVGQEAILNNLRNDVEVAQIDAQVVDHFCEVVKMNTIIHRNSFHAYVSAWANMKFGEGTLARRLYQKISHYMYGPPEVTHFDVLRRHLLSDTSSVEITMELLKYL